MEDANLYFLGMLDIGHQGILPGYSNTLVHSFNSHHCKRNLFLQIFQIRLQILQCKNPNKQIRKKPPQQQKANGQSLLFLKQKRKTKTATTFLFNK